MSLEELDGDPVWEALIASEADEAELSEDDLLSGQRLALSIQADLAELRGVCMGFARKIAAKAENQAKADADEDDLVRLNAAAAKAARAVRFIAVLQLEIDGQRQAPGTRPPAAANGNEAGRGNLPGRGGDYRTRGEARDLWEREAQRECERSEWVTGQMDILQPAMEADFAAAGHPEMARQAMLVKAKLIRAIPHPNVDACLPRLDPSYIVMLFGRNALQPFAFGPDPPEAKAYFDKHVENDRRWQKAGG